MNDPADLSNLADIVMPPPMPWWPLAPGWWIVSAALLIALALLASALLARHHRNAYRRAALAELDNITDPVDAALVSSVLKRAALVAYPRAAVASLTGRAWLALLDRSSGGDEFSRGPAADIAGGAFGGPLRDGEAVLAASRRWVKRHWVES